MTMIVFVSISASIVARVAVILVQMIHASYKTETACLT